MGPSGVSACQYSKRLQPPIPAPLPRHPRLCDSPFLPSPPFPPLPSPPCPHPRRKQKKIDYVLKKAGTKGQLAIIGFLILTLIVLIFLLLG